MLNPSRDEIQATLDWLDTAAGNEPTNAQRFLTAAFVLSLDNLKKGRDPFEHQLTSQEIYSEAFNPIDPEPEARRIIRDSKYGRFISGRKRVLIEWLEINRPSITGYVQLVEVQAKNLDGQDITGGGRGKAVRYRLERRPLADEHPEPPSSTADVQPTPQAAEGAIDFPATPESAPAPHGPTDPPPANPESQSAPQSHLSLPYHREFCDLKELTWWGRVIFAKGSVPRKSWRFRLLLSRFVLMLVACFAIFLGTLAVPVLAGLQPSPIATLLGLATLVIIYSFELRSFVMLSEDRIILASVSLYSGVTPAQIEIVRNRHIHEWRIVRYSSTCPVCSGDIYVSDGAPAFPRRLVGRCSESPREHVFSFDRVTRLGQPLIMPPVN